MKKIFVIIAAMMATVLASAQTIERVTDFEGGKVAMTSAEKLFSGCKMRLCTYVGADKKKIYGIALELTDRATHVSEGNVFTIHFEDGSRITLHNLWDTKAEVTQEHHVDTYRHVQTDFIPVYDAWDDAFYSVPVDRSYTEHVPVTSTKTFTALYYIVTTAQLDKIEKGDISKVSIVTDEETIVKKARPLSSAIAKLRTIL